GWLIPLQILIPAYALPQSIAASELDSPVVAFFGDNLELLGYNGEVAGVAGQPMHFSLCWQALAPLPANDTLYPEVVGADGQGYGSYHGFPGHGNYATAEWLPNAPFCERYAVPIGANIPAPARAQLRVSWQVGTTAQALPLRLSNGQLADTD